VFIDTDDDGMFAVERRLDASGDVAGRLGKSALPLNGSDVSSSCDSDGDAARAMVEMPTVWWVGVWERGRPRGVTAADFVCVYVCVNRWIYT
jgi:hypothetical protein